MLDSRFRFAKSQGDSLSRLKEYRGSRAISRRKFLRYCQGASLTFLRSGLVLPSFARNVPQTTPSGEFQLHPQYWVQRGIEPVLRKVKAGSDEFLTEKYHDQVAAVLAEWSLQILQSPAATGALERVLATSFSANSPKAVRSQTVRADAMLSVWQERFPEETATGQQAFLAEWRSSMSPFSKVFTSEFQVTHIYLSSPVPSAPTRSALLETRIRFELVGTGQGFHREQRVGECDLTWELLSSNELRLRKCKLLAQVRSRALSPVFVDLADRAFGKNPCYPSQLLHGTDYWRSVLDGACGIDIYGHNGVSAGDIDGDGFDDLYICQPAGLPNRLFRNRGDGSFEDITEAAGVGVLENTACALFADIDNDGHQDLIVVRANGPLLFLNDGSGKFRRKPDAFQFANLPQGTFTGAAIADYDRDGWLDIYFCLYSYYQGADQYRYPTPYYAAENGPPNFLMKNYRNGTFRDATQEAGLNQNNTRFSFCCAWSDSNGNGWPDLYDVNDFGRKNLYRNNGDGTFTDIAKDAGVEDVGAGMSVSWLDSTRHNRQDLYVADMWTAAGLRVSMQEQFQPRAGEGVRALYQRHAMGNRLYRNRGDGTFDDTGPQSGTLMGRWAWSSDDWDFDHDGYPEIYIANGMISGPGQNDLNSFFWRQVVANSPEGVMPNAAYEQGWNAINELIRADQTWSGYERNLLYVNNADGTFSDVSAAAGLDFIEDSRTFALADFDHDGRVELVLKNRSAPQLRYLKNLIPQLPPAIALRLVGKKSNRDAIGAAVTIEAGEMRQTRLVQAGSGFLAQHSKELFFGLGNATGRISATIHWPSGLVQRVDDLLANHRFWIEEGSAAIRKEPFAMRTAAEKTTAPETTTRALENFPNDVETWLLVPVAAPDFPLNQSRATGRSLSDLRGKPVLLYFSSPQLPTWEKQWNNLQLLANGEALEVVVVQVEDPLGAETGKKEQTEPHSTRNLAAVLATP